MPDWINYPRASYVLAAYSVAGVGLLGLLVWSWRSWRQRQAEWGRIGAKVTAKDPLR